MNYWTSLKEIGESTMMMSLSWWYRLKEEFGSHQESTFEIIKLVTSRKRCRNFDADPFFMGSMSVFGSYSKAYN